MRWAARHWLHTAGLIVLIGSQFACNLGQISRGRSSCQETETTTCAETETTSTTETTTKTVETTAELKLFDPTVALDDVSSYYKTIGSKTLTVPCVKGGYFGTSSDAGAVDSSRSGPDAWIECTATEDVTTDVALVLGKNYLRVWYKTAKDALVGSSDAKLVRGRYHEITNSNSGFGSSTEALSNGNFYVFEQNNADHDGEVHLYNGSNRSKVALLDADYGDKTTAFYHYYTLLSNNNLVTCTKTASTDGFSVNGRFRMFDGSTGAMITEVTGPADNYELCENGIDIMSSTVFVSRQVDADTDGLTGNGTLVWYNATTGVELFTLKGDHDTDSFGSDAPVRLANGNYVVPVPNNDTATLNLAGSAILLNGSTGAEIGRITGNAANDQISGEGIVEVAGGNYFVLSQEDNGDRGSAKYVDGSTGLELSQITGNSANDRIASTHLLLSNGNLVLLSIWDDNGGSDHGSVITINGSTGAEIDRVYGASAGDKLSQVGLGYEIAVEINNNLFVTCSAAGVHTISGVTGLQTNLEAGIACDELISLPSGNAIVIDEEADDGANINAGAVVIIDGSDGTELTRITGESGLNKFGDQGVSILSNGNFLVFSSEYDADGYSNEPMTMLVSGTTHTEIKRWYGVSDAVGHSSGEISIVQPNSASDSILFVSDTTGATVIDFKVGVSGEVDYDSVNDQYLIADDSYGVYILER